MTGCTGAALWEPDAFVPFTFTAAGGAVLFDLVGRTWATIGKGVGGLVGGVGNACASQRSWCKSSGAGTAGNVAGGTAGSAASRGFTSGTTTTGSGSRGTGGVSSTCTKELP